MAQHITTIQEIRDRTVAQKQHISDDDLLPFDHGTGSNRHRAFTVAEIIEYIKANKLDGMTIGTTAEIKTSIGNPVIVNFYAIDAGTIEAKIKFKVGGSEWTLGNNKPKIEGLYGLEAGNVGTTNLQADTIDAHGEGVTKIQVKKRLVRDNAPGQENEPLLLGPTQVGGGLKVTGNLDAFGGLKVTGNLDAFGGLTLTNHIWNASASDIYSKIDGLGDKQIAFIFNDTSSGITLSPSSGSHLRRSFTIPSYTAVQVVCSGQHVYVVGGEYA